MELYEAESQQIQAIKEFLSKHRRLIALSLLLILLVIVGVKFWRQNAERTATQASNLYQELLIAEFQQDNAVFEDKAKLLMDSYKNTPYPKFAALMLAKQAVATGDLAKAEEHLRWIIKQKDSKNIALQIATERLARVLQQQGKIDEALQLLTSKVAEQYTTIYQEVIGDLYVAKGDMLQAKTAYIKALSNVPAGAQVPLLQMKLMDIGVTEEEIQALAGEQHA